MFLDLDLFIPGMMKCMTKAERTRRLPITWVFTFHTLNIFFSRFNYSLEHCSFKVWLIFTPSPLLTANGRVKPPIWYKRPPSTGPMIWPEKTFDLHVWNNFSQIIIPLPSWLLQSPWCLWLPHLSQRTARSQRTLRPPDQRTSWKKSASGEN